MPGKTQPPQAGPWWPRHDAAGARTPLPPPARGPVPRAALAVCSRWRQRPHKNVVVGVTAHKRRRTDAVPAAPLAPGVTPAPPGRRAHRLRARLRGDSLVRVLWLAEPLRRRLILAVLASAVATGCSIALLGTSGFLLARASQHPNIVAIAMAVVAVRGLSVGRGVFRYAERLASHDVAFRILVDIRVRTFQRLERLAPAGLRTLSPGDVLARLVSDVDATQEVFLRGVAPPAAAAAAGAGAVVACLLILPSAGLVLAAGLLAAGTLVPWLAAARARQTGLRLAPARGEFTAHFT